MRYIGSFGLGLALIIFALAGELFRTQEGPPCTITVAPGQSVQEAIDRAPEEAVICLEPREWEENLIIVKSLTLRAAEIKAEPDVVIKSAKEGQPVILIESEKEIEVRIEGLEITGGLIGIEIHGHAKAVITNNTISDNDDNGIEMWGSSQATIENSTISGNSSNGIMLVDSSRATITNNTISDNDCNGISMLGASQAKIEKNTINGNRYGIWTRDSSNNAINDNWGGIVMWGFSQATIRDNKIFANKEYGVALNQRPCDNTELKFAGKVEGSGNEIHGNGKGNVCPAELEFLRTSRGGCYGPKC